MTIKNYTPVMLTCQGTLPVTPKSDAIPGWYPGDEVKPAPMPLLLVQAFINTVDVEVGSDLLGDAALAQVWMTDAGLLDPGSRVTPAELELIRGARESIRALARANGSQGQSIEDAELAPLRAIADARRARIDVGDNGSLSIATEDRQTAPDGLFELLLIIRAAQEERTWSRLRVCSNPECAWAFYDRSRNQQGNWCDMAVCGNRLKNRQLRARRS
jgi:predicted RNA-binding Zn ribbon-like protein